ncbi:amino acid permease [Francisella frigiditurris]|uniref:Tryptophan/tyrosine permease family protein n=1 Tax=Francisella frigiditurris TaxID=1542390 RepID=A0A1J0KRI9_9GAMM|nr:aromatic amino acid transport family protein [Francisella frigiditurris]APC96384.1 tryptophan/tyrosine permease family protein [Francisella frigiditurris]
MIDKDRFNKFDFGWLIVSFGMAIGAGIVLTPVSIGVVGFTVFALSILIAYPGIYLFQKLYIQTLFASSKPRVYKEVINELLGPKWGIFLGILYFLMMLTWTVIYAEVVAKSLASYLYEFGLISTLHIDQNIIFSAILMIVLIFTGIKSQRLLVRVSTFLVFILVISIVLASISLVPLWKIGNLTSLPDTGGDFIAKTIIMLPFSLTSILFIQSLSPMVIGYRLHHHNETKEIIMAKALRTMKIAFILLVIIIGAYIFSFSLVIPHDVAVKASQTNQSAFLLLEKQGHSNMILHICGVIISICAILTSFLSILGGMAESLKGILKIGFNRVGLEKQSNSKFMDVTVVVVIFLITWLSIVFQAPVYKLVPLSGPIFGILGCLIPAYIVFKTPSLKSYRTKSIYFIIFVGIVLTISPLLTSALS